MTKAWNQRRASLSEEKRALLAKRLQGLSTGREASPPFKPPAIHYGAFPAVAEIDLGRELAPRPGAPRAVSPDLWPFLVATGKREARRLAAAQDLLADAAREPQLDEQSAAFLSAALQRLGVFQRAGEERTIDGLIAECRILPKYRKVLRRWMESLRQEGLVDGEGDIWRAREPVPPPALDALMTSEQRDYYGKNLPAVLTGEVHPLEFYLPGGSSASVESSYRELPIFRYCNGISAEVLDVQARGLPADARLRILEVGAGTGGTTSSLLPLLDAGRTVYHFTDVSKFFTDLGREKLRDYPFVRFRELDIERDPLAQGYAAGSFDWIVAAHVLHATHRIAETLEHVRRLLAPGGILLLLEETRFQLKYNFSMGFLPGFDDFEDHDLRPLHPLLSSAQWREALLAAGFTSFATFTEPASAAEIMGVDVMLAQLPGGE
ncbi:MAG TPA: class I SAM-dependent methyltransferase [Thermoanaerobaculia bacterium]|nr:class I SAM-dependent methyltransferase [Thermoanaerobaculia bacterium]